MKVLLTCYTRIISSSISIFLLLACEKEKQPSTTDKKNPVPILGKTEAKNISSNGLKSPVTSASGPENVSDELTGSSLLARLGAPLSAESQKKLDAIGDLPEMRAAALEPRGKVYAIGVKSDGGLVLHLGEDHSLLAFGYVSKEGEPLTSEEQLLLSHFDLEGEPEVTVLDGKFDPAKMRFKLFKSRTFSDKKAIVYSREKARTVVFFDSGRVPINKLLPASPETMDPVVLEQLKALLEPSK